MGFLTVGLLVLGLGGWSVSYTIAGAIIAPGQVEVSSSRQVVQHPDGGVVDLILVSEGERVSAGKVLVRLNGSALRSELTIVDHQILELEAKQARLQALSDEGSDIEFGNALLSSAAIHSDTADVLQGEKSLFQKQTEALKQALSLRETQIEQMRNQIAGIVAQRNAIEVQLRLLSEDLATQRDLLAGGLTQAARVSSIERDLADLDGKMGEKIAAEAEARGRITQIEMEMAALGTDQREKAEMELRDVTARRSELLQRQAALRERIGRLDLRAPASGVVLGLQTTTPQSVVRPAEPLMYIVPQDRPLLVIARVPVTHVDEVRPGQKVRLVFSSLPSRTTPELTSEVMLVSADAFADERSGTSYFRVEISIDADTLDKLGPVDLLPGMPVSAFIRTEDRTPLAYLLKPFTDYFKTAFRET